MSERLTRGDEDLIRKRSAIGLPVEFWHVESMLAEIDALRRELADEKAERHALKALLDSGKALESQLAETKAEIERLKARHDPNCDVLELSPDLGPSTKPCNCVQYQLAATKAALQKARELITWQDEMDHHPLCRHNIGDLCDCDYHRDRKPFIDALAEIDKLENGQ